MGFTGNLKTLSFGDILQLIATGKKTGMLKLHRRHGARMIYFRGGNVVASASESAAEEERLGQLLLRQNLLDQRDLDRALKRHVSSKKRLGHVLIEMGILERNVVMESLRSQVEEAVYSVFSWIDGDFEFVDDREPDQTQILVELNSLSVMMEGARRFDEYSEIAHDLPSGETVLRMAPSPSLETPEIVLSVEDVDILVAVNGERSVEEIISSGAHGEYVASKSLHRLIKTHLVEKCPDAAHRVSRRNEENQLYDLVFRLYSHSLTAVHRALTEYLGAFGDRLFFSVPTSCVNEGAELIGVLTAGTGGSEELFRKQVEHISDAIRLHRVLNIANLILMSKIQAIRDRVSPAVAIRVAATVQKDVGFLLAQKRNLAQKYDIAREFQQALQGV